jgi:dynein heavy chain
MLSAEGELLPLQSHVRPADAKGAVERWLVSVEAAMLEAVREACAAGLTAYASTPRATWVLQWPGQVVLVASAIQWTQEVDEAIRNPQAQAGGLTAVAHRCTSQLKDIVQLVRGELSNLNRCGPECTHT